MQKIKPYLNKFDNYFIDFLWEKVFKASGIVTILILASIFVFLLINSYGIIGQIPLVEFLFGTNWNPSAYGEPKWGVIPLVVGTFWISITALVLAVPLGIAIAVYLSEIAPRKTREILKPIIEMIGSIPSVILGLLGILFLAPFIARVFNLSNGLNALTAAVLVAITALPTIASISEDALARISNSLREASLALGATKWTTIKSIVVPAAKSGIIASIMLGFGRIIGETMVVLMVAGNSLAFPTSLLAPARPMTASIAIEIKEVVVGGLHWEALFAVGFLLFVITFAINFIVDLFIEKKSI